MNKILATVILILSAATVVPAAATDDRQHAQLRLQLQQGDRINAHIASDGCSIGVQLASAAGAGGLVVAHRLRDRGAHDVHSTDHRGQWSKPHHARRACTLPSTSTPSRAVATSGITITATASNAGTATAIATATAAASPPQQS